jgi:hypothetical protein
MMSPPMTKDGTTPRMMFDAESPNSGYGTSLNCPIITRIAT